MPKISSVKPSKPTDEYFSELSLQIDMERSHALIISDIEATIGITDFQLGGPDPYEKAKSFIREVCGEEQAL